METVHHIEKGYANAKCGKRGVAWSYDLSEVSCLDCKGEGAIKETEGVRQNAGKPDLSPIDPHLLLEMGKGLAIGQEKYGDKAFNRKGNVMKLSTGYASLMRHILKFMCGEDYDVDEKVKGDGLGDGVHHIAKAINCLVVMWHNRVQGDDRNG